MRLSFKTSAGKHDVLHKLIFLTSQQIRQSIQSFDNLTGWNEAAGTFSERIGSEISGTLQRATTAVMTSCQKARLV
jgi:hypothetical protein